MINRFRSVDPVYVGLAIIFGVILLLVLCVAFIRGDFERVAEYIRVTPAHTPNKKQSPTPNPTLILPSVTPTPTDTITATAASTETQTPEEKGDALDPPTPTPTFTPTFTPTPTPPPYVFGIVTVDALNVRWGPGIEYGYAGAVYKGDKVVVSGQELDGSWLKIEASDGGIGWVNARFIEILEGNTELAIIPTPPLPPIPNSDDEEIVLRSLTIGRLDVNEIERQSILSQIGPYQEHWYTFFEVDTETVVLFMFKPNVNFFGDHFIGDNVEAFLYDQHQLGINLPAGESVPADLPGVADSLPNIGAGKYPGVDWDGDLGTGELVWRGGPLVPGTRYYFRFINNTPESLKYCLIPGEVRYWACR